MKKTKYLFPFIFTFSLVSACGSPVTTPVNSNTEAQSIERVVVQPTKKVYVARYSGEKGATLSLKINLPGNNFKTKANGSSVDGVLAKTANDIQSLEVGLCTDKTDINTINNTLLQASWFALSRDSAGGFNFNLENVPAGGPYFAVVKAYDGPVNANQITGNNILLNEFEASTNGVTVGADLALTFAPDPANDRVLFVNLNLLDGTGNNIATSVTVNNGTDPSGYTAQ